MRNFFYVLGVGVPNMSEIECVREVDNKGREIFKFKNQNDIKALTDSKF